MEVLLVLTASSTVDLDKSYNSCDQRSFLKWAQTGESLFHLVIMADTSCTSCVTEDPRAAAGFIPSSSIRLQLMLLQQKTLKLTLLRVSFEFPDY